MHSGIHDLGTQINSGDMVDIIQLLFIMSIQLGKTIAGAGKVGGGFTFNCEV